MFHKVDLQKELKEIKKRSKPDLLKEVNTIIREDRAQEERIWTSLGRDNHDDEEVENFIKLDPGNIYNLYEIREICIKYRLRFLDSEKFVGEIPYEAISKIKQLERELNQPLSKFKIIAPKKLFKLEDKDSDPILFLELPNKTYYFIHKWGGDLNRYRAALAFPLRSIKHMFFFLMAIAFVFALLIPTDNATLFAFLFVHGFIAICGLACLLIFTVRENFSNIEWDSRYLS